MSDQGNQGLLSPWLRKQRITVALPWLTGKVLDFGCGGGHLAVHVDPERYLGFEPADPARQQAQQNYPRYSFTGEIPSDSAFDTIVALAVIEHISRPDEFVLTLRDMLSVDGRIVLTTPHPAFRKVHDFGAGLGVFSQEASEEHEAFLDYRDVGRICEQSRMQLLHARRFLYGANQLFVLRRN